MLLVVAIAVTAAACASQGVLDVALSKNPKGALQGIAKSKVETYKRNPQELVADFDRLKADLTRLYSHLKQESEKQWGPDDGTALPAPKRYVKYTEQYRNRISVDYERSTIRIEHIQEPGVAAKIRGAVVIALLTPQDPKSADVFSDTVPTLDGKPFLQNLVLDQNRRVMATRQDVERFADFLVANRLQVRALSVRGSQVNVTYTQFDMIGAEQDRAAPPPVKPRMAPTRPVIDRSPDARADDRADPNRYAAADKIAPNFLPIVNKYAQSTGVDPALIFAIIYQESRFNPHAVSVAEAYGMMQLVPRSGGMEAFRKAKGESAQPTPEYLMDPENNIELGATYVSMLLNDYWMKNIGNIPSREYCAISGYNTGPGNLARAFTGTTNKLTDAQMKANAMRPDELFDFLRVNLPYAETRDYLLRVSAARRHYQELFYADKK